MAEPHVDRSEHGEVRWFKGCGPVATLGVYNGPCDHRDPDFPDYINPRPIAWGWDFKHYELGQCDRCGSRAWINEKVQATTPWMACDSLVGAGHA